MLHLINLLQLFLPIIDKHAPVKKLTPWIDEIMKNCMVERDGENGVTNKSGCTSNWLTYCQLKKDVTKLNKKNKLYY